MWRFANNSARWIRVLLISAASIIALMGARHYAGSWNDGAALASVESLVDHQTLAIDRSIFVDPSLRPPGSLSPYDPDDELLMRYGTLDKVFVDGHYYAAKPFVPMVMWGGGYWIVQRLSGLTAARRARVFVYVMTLLISGMAYVAAVACLFELSLRILRSPSKAACLAVAFALGTVALAFSRSVNSHLPQLAALMALFLSLDILAKRLQARRPSLLLAAGTGTLLGIAYVFDQGVGPAILLCIVPLVAWRTLAAGRNYAALAVVLTAALPWVVAQHWLNYEVGHTIAAINSRPEHFAWPGSPWNPQTMSGGYSHASLAHFAIYSLKLLFGSKGFVLHNPLLLAAVVGGCVLLTGHARRLPEYPEVVCAAAVAVTTWLVYSWGSNNQSGGCVSIRWFLPLLAPGFYVLALYLRQRPQAWGDVYVLTLGSVVLGLLAWWCGPWHGRMLPGYWIVLALLLMGWGCYKIRWSLARVRRQTALPSPIPLAE